MCQTGQGPSGTRLLRLDMRRSIISLSKLTDQMWCNHPFSQRNKATEKAVEVEGGDDGDGQTKFEKGGVGSIPL